MRNEIRVQVVWKRGMDNLGGEKIRKTKKKKNRGNGYGKRKCEGKGKWEEWWGNEGDRWSKIMWVVARGFPLFLFFYYFRGPQPFLTSQHLPILNSNLISSQFSPLFFPFLPFLPSCISLSLYFLPRRFFKP